MSTTTTPSGPAPWRSTFLAHIAQHSPPTFALGTVAATGVPRARYCIYRGMWGEIPYGRHYDAATHGRNPRAYESELLTFTTDGRMEKVGQIMGTSTSAAAGGGGGGPVEAVFWVQEVMTQWRFKGEAYIVGLNEDGDGDGDCIVRDYLEPRMRVVDGAEGEGEKKEAWSWRAEVAAHFGNLSPGMRGSFKNPAPGTLMGASPSPAAAAALGQTVTGPLGGDEVARANFRVVIIRADEVEQLDLTVPDRARRWRFTYDGGGGGWKKEELWP